MYCMACVQSQGMNVFFGVGCFVLVFFFERGSFIYRHKTYGQKFVKV